MSKLLNKPFKAFSIYSLIILACSIPVYYWVVDFIWLSELDHHNLMIKEQIENDFGKIRVEENELDSLLKNWNKLQPDVMLQPCHLSAAKADSTYTVMRLNEYFQQEDIDRFRGLSSYIVINSELYHLQIETNVEETDETMLAIAVITSLFFVLLVVGFMFLNQRISMKIWHPFGVTLEKLKSFDLTARQPVSFDKTDIEEFAELNRSLQKLIDNNIAVYNQQKAFIENASHELQTPLAVLKSKMNLFLQNKNLTGEQSEILAAIERPLARITRMNKNLLLLARIENNQFAEKEPLELTTIVNETLELLTDYIAAKKITIAKTFTEKLTIDCNRILIEILVNNLLINAIIHNTEKGDIRIELSGRTLIVSNAGSTKLDKEKLFKRFAVSSSETTSSGLGLAIIKEIVTRYQWTVTYTFQNNLHSFSVRF